MAEALAGLSVAANVLQVISFCGNLFTKSVEIYKSDHGTTIDHLELELIATRLLELCSEVTWTAPQRQRNGKIVAPRPAERQFQEICEETATVSKELLEALAALQQDASQGKWVSFLQAIKTIWDQKKIDKQAARIETCRLQLNTTMLVLLE
jgi:hypothetical protein